MTTDPMPQSLSEQERSGVAWHISSFSENGAGSCVEAGPLGDGTGRWAVRHSHHPHGAIIVYTPQEWHAFTAGVRAGEFDL